MSITQIEKLKYPSSLTNILLMCVGILGLAMGLSGITYPKKNEKLSQTEKNKNKLLIGLLVAFLLLIVGFWYYQSSSIKELKRKIVSLEII